MPDLYYANVTIHVLAAMLWLGGMFFLGVIGERFRAVGWWAIGVLVLTGLVNLHYRGWLHWDGVLGSRAFWRTVPGSAEATAFRRRAALLARVNAIVGVMLVAAAVRLARGG